MTLSNLGANESASINQVSLEDEKIVIRLKELGIYTGRDIQCIKKTPFGGPSIFRTGDSVFSLESSLTNCISITKA